ncbi:MAG: response regulator transcription factor [Lentisphaeria bacterium]|nr:response regulator transcription factor [Lentisphaeria bacterium]
MRILLVEDDSGTAGFVVQGLKQAGFAVTHAADGVAGLEAATLGPYDAAVVDIMLPGLDGLSLIQRLRRRGIRTPVLVLSAKRSVDDRVRGLQAGGDDYLVKPFAFAELQARVHALIRRSAGQGSPDTIQVEDLTVDLGRRRVSRGDEVLDLKPKEYALIEYLAWNRGRVVTKTMIMEHVWDFNFDPQANVVEAAVCRLREKIDRPYARKLIQTVRGVGYVLE